MNNKEYMVAKNALCRIINCDINKSPLRWTESAGNIVIHNCLNGEVICRITIYTTTYYSVTSYYIYFYDKKYKDAAAGIADPNLLTVTSAGGHKFKNAGGVINFVKEVVRRAEYREFQNMKKTDYAKNDCNTTYNLSTTLLILECAIKDVIFNDPATIVLWSDDTKTVVKCRDGEEFDPEKGLALAIAKKAMGNKYNYYDVFKKYIGKYNKKKINKNDKIVTMPKSLADTWKAQDKVLRDLALNTAKNLRAEGKSLAEIAKIMGYNDPAVVRSILPDEEDSSNG